MTQLSDGKDPSGRPQPFCDYCGQPSGKVGAMVEGTALVKAGVRQQNAHICASCVETAEAILEQYRPKGGIGEKRPTPRELVANLDDYIIGQDRVKRTLSVAVVNHYKRLAGAEDLPEVLRDVNVSKSNVLLIGPTGCGKTALAQTLARRLNVPFAIGDATTLTEAGYVGEDVENLILKLVREANDDIALAEQGIIYIDEIDKIGKTSQNVSITRDVSGEGVQQAILKLLEGTVANVPPAGGRKHPEQQYLHVDTTQILFICGGTFVGLEEIIAKRLGRKMIGFGRATTEDNEARRDELIAQVTPEDLERFGMIPELIGRLPVIGPLAQLTERDLARILTEPKDALLKQYQVLFHMDGAKLEYTQGAVDAIARIAKTKGTGARALRSVVENLMLDPMFDLPERPAGETYMLTEAVVEGKETLVPREAA